MGHWRPQSGLTALILTFFLGIFGFYPPLIALELPFMSSYWEERVSFHLDRTEGISGDDKRAYWDVQWSRALTMLEDQETDEAMELIWAISLMDDYHRFFTLEGSLVSTAMTEDDLESLMRELDLWGWDGSLDNFHYDPFSRLLIVDRLKFDLGEIPYDEMECCEGGCAVTDLPQAKAPYLGYLSIMDGHYALVQKAVRKKTLDEVDEERSKEKKKAACRSNCGRFAELLVLEADHHGYCSTYIARLAVIGLAASLKEACLECCERGGVKDGCVKPLIQWIKSTMKESADFFNRSLGREFEARKRSPIIFVHRP